MRIQSKFPLVITLLLGGLLTHASAESGGWLTDYAKALQQAKAENKPILLDFTGSDWCGWCIRMKKEALDTPQFKQYAAKNLILVEVDFPQEKPQTSAVKKQNAELQSRFSASGYPTFILLSKDEKKLGEQVGYLEGGANAFIKELGTFYKPAPHDSADAGGNDAFFKAAAASKGTQ